MKLDFEQRQAANELLEEMSSGDCEKFAFELIHLRAEVLRMRTRIESLRGLCKTAVGYLWDAEAEYEAMKISALIGDMEPPLK